MTNKNESNKEKGITVELINLSDIESEEIGWFWYPYIANGKLTLMEGDPGIGKSYITCSLSKQIANGEKFPLDDENRDAGLVLMLNAEDGISDTIKPRLEKMGADTNRIDVIDGMLLFDNEGGLNLLEQALTLKSYSLVIIDPLMAYIGNIDIHKANQVRQVMANLARLAHKFYVPILCIRHLTKGIQTKAIYRGIGSIDLTASVRSVLMVGVNAKNADERALFQIKNNLAPLGKAISYSIDNGTFIWNGESSLTVAEVLDTDIVHKSKELDNAKKFISDLLLANNKIMESKELVDIALSEGFSKQTIRRAKEALMITMGKEFCIKKGKKWYCLYPEIKRAQTSEDVQKSGSHKLNNLTKNKLKKSSDE